jgi:hypothetical protein
MLYNIASRRVPVYRRTIYFLLNGRKQPTHTFSLILTLSSFDLWFALSLSLCLSLSLSIFLFLAFLFKTRKTYIALKKKLKKKLEKVKANAGIEPRMFSWLVSV